MEYSFPRYLLAKQSVDDRALNKDVLNTLRAALPTQPVRIIEIGAGIGTMLRRLIAWDVIRRAEYVLVDRMTGNMEYASSWIKSWAAESILGVESRGENRIRVFDQTRDIHILLEQKDVFEFIPGNSEPADLLIANAVLDLIPMPGSLPQVLSLTRNLAWLTINFDGLTSFEPVIDPRLDHQIERLYHRTMDTRPTGGDSRIGRHLIGYLRNLKAQILAAGASDWIVHAVNGKYPHDEAYFLHFILHFLEESLTGYPGLDAAAFTQWLEKRHAQIERGELVYIAHQVDFLVKQFPGKSV